MIIIIIALRKPVAVATHTHTHTSPVNSGCSDGTIKNKTTEETHTHESEYGISIQNIYYSTPRSIRIIMLMKMTKETKN